MAYVYRHIRLDKNIPFYIGIGGDVEYKRAKTKVGRNKIWNRIVSKSDYEIDIMVDGLTWEEACNKEIEFISLYGRMSDGKGVLCNLTDGGDGAKNLPKETRDKICNSTRKSVCQYDKQGKFIRSFRSVAEAYRELGVTETAVSACMKGGTKTVKNHVFRWFDGNFNDIDLSGVNLNENERKVNCYDKSGKYISTFSSMKLAGQSIGVSRASINQATIKNYFVGEFAFRYFEGHTEDIDTSGMGMKKTFKKVDQFSVDGKLIETHDGLIIAQEKTGVNRSLISACCIGRQKTAGGYIWRHNKT